MRPVASIDWTWKTKGSDIQRTYPVGIHLLLASHVNHCPFDGDVRLLEKRHCVAGGTSFHVLCHAHLLPLDEQRDLTLVRSAAMCQGYLWAAVHSFTHLQVCHRHDELFVNSVLRRACTVELQSRVQCLQL